MSSAEQACEHRSRGLSKLTVIAPPRIEAAMVNGSARHRSHQGVAVAVGVLLGLAAAVPGVVSFIPAFGIRPWHILVCGALALALASTPGTVLRRVKITALDVAVVLYACAYVLVEYSNSTELGFRLDLVAALSPFFFLIGFYAARIAVDGVASARWLLTGFATPAIPAAVVAVLQLGSPAFSAAVLRIAPGPGLEARLADGRLIRATGLVGHWTGSGFYFCTALAAACTALVLCKRQGFRVPPVTMISLVAAVFGAVSSLTITVVLTALVVVIMTLVVVGVRAGRIAALLGLVAVVYFQFGDYLSERLEQQTAHRSEYVPAWVPNTIAYRWKIWTEQTIPMIRERPWSGWGTNVYNSADRPRQLVWGSAESQWFGGAISSGVVVTAMLAATLLAALILVARGSTKENGRWKLPMVGLLVSVLLASFTVPLFTNRGLPIGIWVLFGVVLAVDAALSRDIEDVESGER